ncbi:Uncharacterised protein [Klebsiella pneumoniae]|nr:Uncharacterised protein [Klebsiella pneumoniae]
MHPPSPTAVNGSVPRPGDRIFQTDDTAVCALHTLRSARGPSAPVRRYPAQWGAKARGPARWHHILCRHVFPVRSGSPGRRCASAPAVQRHPHPGNSAHHHTPGSRNPLAAGVFHRGGVIRGTVCGCGSDAECAVLPGHPPDRSAYRSLSEAGSDRLPFVRYGGRLFRNGCRSSSGEVYPAAPADGLFRAPGLPAFPAGHGSALPVWQGAVSAEGYRQKRCHS